MLALTPAFPVPEVPSPSPRHGYTWEAVRELPGWPFRPYSVRVASRRAVSAVKGCGCGDAGMFPGWWCRIAATIVAFVVGYVVIIDFLEFVSTFSQGLRHLPHCACRG